MTRSPRTLSKSERTRQTILTAAAKLFAERGYDATTMRDIGTTAGIDPAMIVRYFGTKEALFARAATITFDVPDLSGVPQTRIGEALVRYFLEVWETAPAGGGLIALLRAAPTNSPAADRLREIFSGQIAPLLAQATKGGTTAEIAGLVTTQMLGLAYCRYILKLPPVVNMTPEETVSAIGAAVQAHLNRALA